MDYEIISPFAPNIFKSKLKSNFDDVYNSIKSDTKFIPHKTSDCFVSDDFYILNQYDSLKSEVESCFNYFKNEILLYESTEFKLTTSWATKVRPGGSSHYHNHKNCMYSGVLYFDDIKLAAPIEFNNSNLVQESFLVNPPVRYNIYNNDRFAIHPSKNTIIFFPSYLMHRVGCHGADDSRYSLAFNFMPDGIYGYADSTVRLEIF